MRWEIFYARLALGAAFLSAVASRFGLWTHQPAAARFREFIAYTGEICAFMPARLIPVLAWSATAAETAFGIALIASFKLRERHSVRQSCWRCSVWPWPSRKE